jgi:hypothetical protein
MHTNQKKNKNDKIFFHHMQKTGSPLRQFFIQQFKSITKKHLPNTTQNKLCNYVVRQQFLFPERKTTRNKMKKKKSNYYC